MEDKKNKFDISDLYDYVVVGGIILSILIAIGVIIYKLIMQ